MENRFVSGPRRGFAFITILLIIPVVVHAADRNSRQLFDISPRQDSNFSSGWVFVPREEPGVEKADFQDAAFERVSVPHANIMLPHETFDPDTFRFVSWYRKHFTSNRQWEGRTVEVEFQGVMSVADVYLNGRLLGHHAGGYTPFSVDLTPALNFNAENVLSVRVDSTEQRQVPPEGAEKMFGYYLFGGIQREVTLRVLDPLHISHVYHTTPQVQPVARLETRISIANGRTTAFDGTIRVHLLDAKGTEITSAEIPAKLSVGEKHEFEVNLDQVRNVKSWDVDHPVRYVAIVEVRGPNGPVDRVRTWVGFRTIRWDDVSGQFSLNGLPLKLRGMNRHQTFAYMGGAAPNRLQRHDARILKYELGLNFVRSSHYPPDPEFLDECDRIGLLVMDEFPSWQFIGKSEEWHANAIQAIREMILRDRNHPSIVLWGVRGNEASRQQADDRDLYTQTYALAKELDPSRPPAGARLSESWHGKFVPNEVMTVNDYSNWENPEAWPQPVTEKPWLITEYGHPEQFPVWGGEDRLLHFTMNWMNYLDRLYKHPEIVGGVGWAAFDYNSPEFDTPTAVTAHHCVDDIFRLPKGFSAAAIGSQVDPTLYGYKLKIMSNWDHDSDKIYVASNAPEVELEVNGKSLGRKKPSEFTHAPHPLFLFHVDGFEAGRLLAKAWVGDKVVASDVVHTPERAERLLLQSDDKELIADGTDMTRVVIAAVDDRGTLVRKYDHRVFIEVRNGTLIGENPIHLEGGRIAVYVQSRDSQVLPIRVRVTSTGLATDTLQIAVHLPLHEQVSFSDFDLEELNTESVTGASTRPLTE